MLFLTIIIMFCDNNILNSYYIALNCRSAPITPLTAVPKCDASVQTDNDIVTDESPEFAARPPPCLKREMIPTTALFREIDRRVLEVSPSPSIDSQFWHCSHPNDRPLSSRHYKNWWNTCAETPKMIYTKLGLFSDGFPITLNSTSNTLALIWLPLRS